MDKYIVTYRNEGRSERTRAWDTEAEARESADFLKFQGAKSIRVRKVEGR